MSSKRSSVPPYSRVHPGDARVVERAQSRRQFFRSAAGAAGFLLLPDLWRPALANPGGTPTPIPRITPGPFGPLHFFFPGPVEGIDPNHGHDPSVITDFNGFIGEADLILTGTGTDTATSASAPYKFHTDMRFMLGEFVGTDGKQHRSAFAFI